MRNLLTFLLVLFVLTLALPAVAASPDQDVGYEICAVLDAQSDADVQASINQSPMQDFITTGPGLEPCSCAPEVVSDSRLSALKLTERTRRPAQKALHYDKCFYVMALEPSTTTRHEVETPLKYPCSCGASTIIKSNLLAPAWHYLRLHQLSVPVTGLAAYRA